ncbi:hypothetical protein D9757_013114 [Collybiopsis confluens]|uniref:Uncharacterized protein n=1 Tax=Collybiopsis confluens TaxID=2823264 RepID=A0A8H5CYJ6_9AGAR|nr:hypothetical protein D9757_013114 [Collybiopsis confluens]
MTTMGPFHQLSPIFPVLLNSSPALYYHCYSSTTMSSFSERAAFLQSQAQTCQMLQSLIQTPNIALYHQQLLATAQTTIIIFQNFTSTATKHEPTIRVCTDLSLRLKGQDLKGPDVSLLKSICDQLVTLKNSSSLDEGGRTKLYLKVNSTIGQLFVQEPIPKTSTPSIKKLVSVVEIPSTIGKKRQLPSSSTSSNSVLKKARSPAVVPDKDLANDESMGPLAEATASASGPMLIDLEDEIQETQPTTFLAVPDSTMDIDTSSTESEVPVATTAKKHSEPNRPSVRFLPLCQVPFMLTSSPLYKKALLFTKTSTSDQTQADSASELCEALNVANNFLDPKGKTSFTYSQPDSAFVVAATAEGIKHPAAVQLNKEANSFINNPETTSWMQSSQALHERIGKLQATIAGISYDIGYLLQSQKLHEQELRRLMKELHTVKAK